jgi:hypothetical protein
MSYTNPSPLVLGAVFTALAAIDRAEEFAYEERRAFHAPSECDDLIARGADGNRARVLERFGLDEHSIVEECQRRGIDGRWLQLHGPRIPGVNDPVDSDG